VSRAARSITIVGAGLAGALLALLCARRGIQVTLYERRPDPRQAHPEQGRSINLALAARGISALEQAGVMEAVRPHLIGMRGRMVHEPGASASLQPYGQRAEEVIWSVGRAELNRVLIDAAARHAGVAVHFSHACLGVDPQADRLHLRDTHSGTEREVALTPTIATDGAGSVVRTGLAGIGAVAAREDWLDHDYKELTIPARDGRHALERHALHVWPRGGFMLIALPNTDGSFTATLFLARHGAASFARLTSAAAVSAFFAREFPDVVPYMPDLVSEFASHPQGRLGTVHVTPWHLGGKVLLLGDAAHAIVPFHGQGMNAAFEDCAVLDPLLAAGGDLSAVFGQFERARRGNTEAIAQMAIENYQEMRATVRDAVFVRRRAIAMALERAFPGRFIPRYSMVMFHPEIPYADALRRGEIQARILGQLDRGAGVEFDAAQARTLIEAQLPALPGRT
jgi:kynurenine 3-monooxygenase